MLSHPSDQARPLSRAWAPARPPPWGLGPPPPWRDACLSLAWHPAEIGPQRPHCAHPADPLGSRNGSAVLRGPTSGWHCVGAWGPEQGRGRQPGPAAETPRSGLVVRSGDVVALRSGAPAPSAFGWALVSPRGLEGLLVPVAWFSRPSGEGTFSSKVLGYSLVVPAWCKLRVRSTQPALSKGSLTFWVGLLATPWIGCGKQWCHSARHVSTR